MKEKDKPQDKEASLWEIVAGFLVLLLGIFFLGKLFDVNFIKTDEIKSYSAICKTKVVLNVCDYPDYAQVITTYKVSYDSQRVISDVAGMVHKYTDCSIRDKKNWSCNLDDMSSTFGFNSGTYFDIPDWSKIKILRDLVEKQYYVSRLEYFNLKANDCGIPYPICYFFNVLMSER